MKNISHLLLTVLLIVFAGRSQAQVSSIWFDDFETDKGWVLSGEFERGAPAGGVGDHGQANPTSAFSGSSVLGTDLDGAYPNNLNDREYTAISPVIDCSGYMNIQLDFQRWLNVEQPAYDHAYIEVSTNGIDWNVVWENGTTIEENSWSNQVVDISAYADDNATVQIRFALGSTDVGWFYSGWNIDDVNIKGTVLPSDGDYRSRRDGNWNQTNMWQRYNGSAWQNVSNYPGELEPAGVVTLMSGDIVNVNVTPSYSIQELNFEGNNGGTIRLDFTAGQALTIDGAVNFSDPSGGRDQLIYLDAGTLNCGSINMVSTGQDNSDHELRISTGTLNVSANISMAGSAAQNAVNFTGAGTINVGGDFKGGSLSNVSGCTVNFNGTTGTQTMDSYLFENISFKGAAQKLLTNSISVNGLCAINSNLYTDAFVVDGTGTVNVASSATLGIGHADGITLAGTAAGNIQTTTRNYDAGATYIYNGAAAQQTGDGLPAAVNEVRINNISNVSLSKSVSVSVLLNLQDGNLLIGDYDLTILDGATFSGVFDNTHMVVGGGAGFVKKQVTNIADLNMLFPIGTNTDYTPLVISNVSGSVLGTAEVGIRMVNNTAPEASAIDLLRYWELTESNLTLTSADIEFNYMDADVAGEEADYELKRYNTVASAWEDPANPSADIATNTLTTTGGDALSGVWTARGSTVAWYTLKSGNWNDPTVWTLDPSGAIYNNPTSYYPQGVTDQVVIKSGREITMNINNVACNFLTIEGVLYLGNSSGHTFNKILGNGRVYMQADNFPTGDATHFVTKNQGQGTVIFNGGGYSISNAHTFYDVEIDLSASNEILTLLNNLTINNNLTLKQGQLRINDNTATTVLSVEVNGNIEVLTNGALTVGQGNTIGSYSIGSLPPSGQYHSIYHQMIVKGDFVNRGFVRFTNETAPLYNALSTVGGVTLRFEGASNNSLSCYGTTDLYNLVVDKGVDKTYVLNVYADYDSYFRLFGANVASRVETVPFTVENPEVRKSLWIKNGTLKLTGSIHIPTLSEASAGRGDFAIGQSARLWLSGANVTVYSTASAQSQIPGFEGDASGVRTASSNQALALIGELKVEDGLFGTRNSAGIVYWPSSNSILEVNGGLVNISQFRSTGSASGRASYIQTGGQVVVRGNRTEAGEVSSAAAIFGLSSEDDVFTMSGGEILIQDDSGSTYDLYIPSTVDNANVTGGTIRFYYDGNADKYYDMYVVPSVYNLTIDHERSDRIHEVNLRTPLVVLNDLIINGSGYLNHRGNNVTVGRNFTIDDNAYNHGYSTANNTLTFSGTEDATFYIGHPVLDAYELPIFNFTLNKPAGKRLLIDSSPEKAAPYVEANAPSNPWYARIIQVENEFRIESGILDQGEHAIRMYGALFVGANGICGIYEHGTTHKYALVMIKDVGTITTEKGAELGNIKMNPQPQDRIFDLTSDVVIKRISYYHGRMNLGAYNLKVDYIHQGGTLNPYTVSMGDAADEMLLTDGSASSGGLSVLINGNGTYAFPIGVLGKYTPAELIVSNYSDDGYVTVRPVDGELKTTNLSGGNLLDYYWRVGHTDFTTLPTVQYNFYYDASDDLASDDANFYPGKVLDENPYTRSYENELNNVDEGNNIITFNDTRTTSGGAEVSDTRAGFTLENANYTAGVANRFTGSPRIYYSRDLTDYPDWRNLSAWTRNDHPSFDSGISPHDHNQPAAGSYPQDGDIAVVGWVPWGDAGSDGNEGEPHGIWISNRTETCAELVFTQMEDVSGNPTARVYRNNFQFRPMVCINQPNGQVVTGLVRGEGMFWCRDGADPDFTLMDIGEFAKEDSAYVVYENFYSPRTINNTPGAYPNLMIANNNWGRNNHDITFSKDVVTNGDFEILGNANCVLSTGVDGDLIIGRDLIFLETKNTSNNQDSGGGAELAFQNTGSARVVRVAGDIRLENTNNQIRVRNADGSAIDHELYVNGNITQTAAGSGLDLWTDNTFDRVTLYLQGTESMIFDVEAATSVPDLYRLVITKGVDQSVTANFVSEFNLNGLTNGATKALELNSGTLILDNPALNINLTTGSENFEIPSTAALILREGTVNASGSSGIELDGLLQVEGGTLNMAGADNPIIYSGSGNATINVSGGNLIVGGQVRRGTISDIGILSYTQTAGVVRVGTGAATVNTRGVFEVLGAGSQFTHTGGSLSIENAQTTPTIAALLLEPENSSINSASTISIGGASTNASQVMGINSSIDITNLKLDNSSGNNPMALLMVQGLTLTNDIEIDAGATFDASGLDLTVGGDFISNGTFTHNNNSTYLNGTATQIISGDINFFNLDKSGTQELILDAAGANLNIANNFVFAGGTLTANNNEVTVLRNVNFDGTQVVTGGNGLILNGNIAQTFEGAGTFDVLTINNSAGVDVPLGNELTVNTNLRLQRGVLNIDKNLLILNSGSTIEAVNPFSATNMIQTNISFTDNGVRKYFNTTPKTFIYPMGAGGKYTPVTIRIDSNVSSTGYITVKAADEYHPSVIDPGNVLDYHWIMKSEDISGFAGEIRMKYDINDVNVSGGNTIDDYITARLLADGSGDWNKDLGTIDQLNRELVFDLTSTAITSSELSGDYTAGVDPAIPDKVPSYISITDGPWNQPTTWDTYPTSGGSIPVGGPRGSIVIIDAGTTVDVPGDGISSYQTTINGTLSLGNTFAHRLGEVDGIGTLSAETGVMPAGVYDSFVASTGGTLEYGGTNSYSILGDLTSVNNLSFTGTNERRLPNHHLTVAGELYINGAALVNNNDKNLILKNDFTFDGGSFDSGDNGARIIFNGTSLQTIDGLSALTGVNGVDYLQVNNSAGIAINTDVDVDNYLNLSNGIIFNNSGNNLVVKSNLAGAIIGGGAASYVQGPLTKLINNGDSFNFPIGDADRLGDVIISNTITSGADYWTAEYFNNNPANEGKDPANVAGDIQFVSQNEYWRVQGPASGQAKVTLRWDNLSGVTPDANFRVVEWQNTLDWNEVAIATANTTNKTVATANRVAFNEFASEGNYFTFGSILIPAYTWLGTGPDGNWFNTANWQGGILPSAGTNITLNDAGNAPFIPDEAQVAQVNDLTIDHSLGLTMQPGAQLTVNGNLVTNDNLVINNTNTKPTSLITHGSVTGNITVNWTYDNQRWWFIGHSISNPIMDEYEKIRNPQANDYAMYDMVNNGSLLKISADPSGYDLAAQNELKGYLFKVKNSGALVSQVGSLNTNATYQRVLQDDWQIMANPYASYYKLPKQTRAGADFEHTTGTVYVTVSTRNSDKTFDTFNTISGLSSPETFTNGIIAPGQAFYVKTEPGHAGQMVYMREGNRIHDVNKISLKTAVKEEDVLRVKLNNGELTDEAVIALRENGDLGFSRIDSEQRFVSDNNLSYIYSVIDNTPVVINVLPQNMFDRSVDISIKPKIKTNHTIHIEGLNSMVEDYQLFLEDRKVQVMVEMTANSEYTFEADPADKEERFVLHFKEPKTEVPTDINDVDTDESDVVRAYVQKGSVLTVDCQWNGEKQVMLYTIEGRLVASEEFKGDIFTKDLSLRPGVYIVKVIGRDDAYEQKLYID
ncbi:hypothetical protein KDU71_15050 [Carboxylicivirga sediminis]|uniref:Secretion system C-terminal sorting domain-containing protein n=1 Tax=Carboxylicivirga sediminis TaxID=2006564 RepID=A0A941F6J8_9BACT|nr:hypothetical protein [Carboxylicivirga sediminis]MBR8536888.1 hypothetical protein [Carboxylicivirga sediminis]